MSDIRRGLVIGLAVGFGIGFVGANLAHRNPPMMYVFNQIKTFTALPGYVYVAGTLTGDGVPHRFNTVQVTCYQDRKVCQTNSIAGISRDMCQLSRLDSPFELAVDRWDENEVEASGSYGPCSKTTVVINLKTEIALWVAEPANTLDTNCAHAISQTYRWTIEKPDMFNPQPKGRWDE